ncbi:MAG: GNAT family N-acetyltransferase, partial [Anaerolineae bacterium]
MQVQYYHDASAFDNLRAEWNPLVFASAANEIFLTLEWQEAWWRHLGGGELWITAVRDPAGALLAIFPCHVLDTTDGRRLLRFIGCVEVTDYLDFILAKGLEEALLELFVEGLGSEEAPAWDSAVLCNISQTSKTLEYLPALARQAGFQVAVKRRDVCPIIPLPASWEEYLMMLDKTQRHEIRRKLRRAQSEAMLE